MKEYEVWYRVDQIKATTIFAKSEEDAKEKVQRLLDEGDYPGKVKLTETSIGEVREI